MTIPVGRPTGRFTYDTATDSWEWDDEVVRIHGLEPGSVTPTTKLVLASKHPEDRDRVAEVIERAGRTAESFSISYRLIRSDGQERRIVLVGEPGLCEEDDQPASIAGFYVDLTEDFVEESEEYATQAVAASAEHRATIEQAKGVLMLAYGLDPDQSFAMLRWWSRNRNVKVRDLAEKLVDLAGEGEIADADLRRTLDAAMHDLTV